MTGPDFAGVDIDLLADYLGGALDGTPDEAAVAALIADDPAWRSAHDTLTGAMASVETSLRALGAESEPMPADIAVRLDRALAQPPAEDAGDTSAAGARSDDESVVDSWPIGPELATPALPHLKPSRSRRHLSVVPDAGAAVPDAGSAVPDAGSGPTAREPVAARGRRRMRWAAPAAAAAAVLAFAGYGIDRLASDGSASNSAADTAAAGSAPEGGTPMLAPGGGRAAAAPPDDRIASSGANYEDLTLADTGMRTFASEGSRAGDASPKIAAPSVDSPLDRLRARDALVDCLDAIARDGGAGDITVESVDYARYRGKPAVIVRFTAATGTWVQASGPDCGASGGDSAALALVKVG